jgi:hypothetical protein
MSKKLEQAIADIVNASAMIQSDYNDKFIDGKHNIARGLQTLDKELNEIKKELLTLEDKGEQ